MREILAFIIATICISILGADQAPEQPQAPVPDVEPPHQFYIENGDKKIAIELGKPFKLDVSKDQDLVLKQKPERVFDRLGISFSFPQDCTYEFEDDKLPIWTIKSRNSMIMVQHYKNQPADFIFPFFVKGLEIQYKNQAKTTEEAEKLGTITLNGKLVEPNIILSATVEQHVYPIQINNDTVIILIQHTRMNDGKLYEDSKALLKMLRETFKMKN